MGKLFQNWAGWMKVIGYAVTLYVYFQGMIGVEKVVIIGIIISGVARLAEGIVKLTPTTVDDERVADVIKLLKDKGIIKT